MPAMVVYVPDSLIARPNTLAVALAAKLAVSRRSGRAERLCDVHKPRQWHLHPHSSRLRANQIGFTARNDGTVRAEAALERIT